VKAAEADVQVAAVADHQCCRSFQQMTRYCPSGPVVQRIPGGVMNAQHLLE
jgi:hypothetical protein